MMKVTYTTPLELNGQQKSHILEVLESHQFCWDECSKVKFNIEKNSIVELHAQFYHRFRESQPQIPAQVVIAAEQSVLSAYRSIKSNKHKITTPPIRKNLAMRLDKRSYSYKNGVFSIISLGKRIKCQPYIYPKLKELLSKYTFCDPLLYIRDDRIFIALTFEIGTVLPQGNQCIGVDLGIRVAAATSEGRLYIDKKFNGHKRRIRHLKDRLKSKGTRSAKRHLYRIRRKERNLNKNFVHNLTKRILKDTKANVIVIENLKSIKVKKNKFQKINRLSQALFGKIKDVLTYKAPIFGKTVIQVSPSYTSQIDSVTGKKDGIRVGRRYYSATGKIYDSDVNGSNNIALRAKHPVSLFNGTYGQARVTKPIV
jgi:IS605 OrfB family transposase